MGIGLRGLRGHRAYLTFLRTAINAETGYYSVIDYRIYDPDGDGHTKLDHLADMLNDVVLKKKIPVAKVRRG